MTNPEFRAFSTAPTRGVGGVPLWGFPFKGVAIILSGGFSTSPCQGGKKTKTPVSLILSSGPSTSLGTGSAPTFLILSSRRRRRIEGCPLARRETPPSFDTALSRLLRMRFCGRLRGRKEGRRVTPDTACSRIRLFQQPRQGGVGGEPLSRIFHRQMAWGL